MRPSYKAVPSFFTPWRPRNKGVSSFFTPLGPRYYKESLLSSLPWGPGKRPYLLSSLPWGPGIRPSLISSLPWDTGKGPSLLSSLPWGPGKGPCTVFFRHSFNTKIKDRVIFIHSQDPRKRGVSTFVTCFAWSQLKRRFFFFTPMEPKFKGRVFFRHCLGTFPMTPLGPRYKRRVFPGTEGEEACPPPPL